MRYHVTYTTHDGTTEVGRVNAPDRGRAIGAAAVKFNRPRSAIRSAVACPEPRPAVAKRKPCGACNGNGKRLAPYGQWVTCVVCVGTGVTR